MKPQILWFFFLSMIGTSVFAAKLTNVNVTTRPGNLAEFTLTFDETVVKPTGFTINDPAKIVLDFSDVELDLNQELTAQTITDGVARTLHFVQTTDKMRMVIGLADMVPYEFREEGNQWVVTLSSAVGPAQAVSSEERIRTAFNQPNKQDLEKEQLLDLDFRVTDKGEGKLIIDMSSNYVPIDFREEGKKIFIDFHNVALPEKLNHTFDVEDFGTPVRMIDVTQSGQDVLMALETEGEFDKIAYQMNNQFIVEVRSLTKKEKEELQQARFQFTGERLSLNFQDIEVRAVVQIIAEFTGINIVTSDTVTGNVTLRLDDVPWDQALDMIMKANGLGKREMGTVLLIAPTNEIAVREQLELQAQQQQEDLAPIKSEYVQVNYAKAEDLYNMVNTERDTFLSTRGKIIVDVRTNSLIIQDTAQKIADVRELIERFDIPVKQVLIESQIVETTNDFSENLGLRFGGAASANLGRYKLGVGPSGVGSSLTNGKLATGIGMRDNARAIATASQDVKAATVQSISGLFTDLTTAANGYVGLALSRLPGGTILDLELLALEALQKSKIISRPKLLTLDQQTASIESGQEIPYQTVSDSGTQTEFRSASIRLEVTPQITPNEKIMLELSVNSDRPSTVDGAAGPAISTQNIQTSVLVDNGETIVLGGIYSQNASDTVDSVPVLNKLPIVGALFRNKQITNTKSETLIFVTPKILKPFASQSEG